MKPLECRVVKMLKKVETTETTGSSIHFHLTKREKEIVNLVGAGLSNADIAIELHISLYTVSNHMCHILKKTGARNRVAAYAIVQKQHRTSGGSAIT